MCTSNLQVITTCCKLFFTWRFRRSHSAFVKSMVRIIVSYYLFQNVKVSNEDIIRVINFLKCKPFSGKSFVIPSENDPREDRSSSSDLQLLGARQARIHLSTRNPPIKRYVAAKAVPLLLACLKRRDKYVNYCLLVSLLAILNTILFSKFW